MPAPVNDQAPNLKHRLTGAVILIGSAVAVVSLLLGPGDTGDVVPRPEVPAGESFVSRIVGEDGGEDGGERRVPAPTSAPTEPASATAPLSDLSDTGLAEQAPAAGTTKEAAATPEPDVKPVLKPDTSLPKPIPRLNTVKAGGATQTPGTTTAPIRSSQSEAPSERDDWIVRVGAFSENANAVGVSRRLGEGGYKTASETVTVNGKPMIRVWVGPYPDRKTAVRAKSAISKDYGLNGFVDRRP